MTERQVTPQVLSLVKRLQMRSCALEIKLAKGPSIPFAAVVEHQRQALIHAKEGQVVFKIPDLGGQNPFDAFVLAKAEAYVVIVFYEPRKLKIAAFIDIHDWLAAEQRSGRKSITLDGARDIAAHIHSL